jgi:hypothetical protein
MLLNTILPAGRLIRIGAIAFAFLLLAFLSQHLFFKSDYIQGLYTTSDNLNIAVFATSGNYHLCQLHMSAALMGYPAHTLINWNDPEDEDPMKQHLAKIEGALRFLEEIPAAQQDDLVFMVDGYDLWFQLPHSYIVKRYRDVVKKSHERHVAELGETLVAKHNIRNTVLFGPDKQCAPAGKDHASCWAVPKSWMPPLSFGPDTDHGRDTHNRPRWLNSGTIIGPARELRDVFAAALERNKNQHLTDSDQFYFASLFGEQSYARRLLKLEHDKNLGLDTAGDEEFLHPKSGDESRKVPELKGRVEYFIGLDWSSAIFQTTGFYADYIAWIRHNESSAYITQNSKDGNYHHHFTLQSDLVGKGPGAPLERVDPALQSWKFLPLATNTASRNVVPVMHINGKKGYRILWWPRMWFFPYIEQIFKELRDGSSGGKRHGDERNAFDGAKTFNKGGSGWIDWKDVCGKYEGRLMGKSREPE